MWFDGEFEIDSVIFRYEAKVYDEGSKYGINGGRIPKLRIESFYYGYPEVCIQYDRGEWLMEPKNDFAKKALNYVLNLYL